MSFFIHGVRCSNFLNLEEPYQSIPNLVVQLYWNDDIVKEIVGNCQTESRYYLKEKVIQGATTLSL